MSLAPGEKLGPYEIRAPLGAGAGQHLPCGCHLRRTYGVQRAFEQWATFRLPLVRS